MEKTSNHTSSQCEIPLLYTLLLLIHYLAIPLFIGCCLWAIIVTVLHKLTNSWPFVVMDCVVLIICFFIWMHFETKNAYSDEKPNKK